MFLRLSKVNHHCLGNSDHHYVSEFGVKVLIATTTIRRGQEITFCYKGLESALQFQTRREDLNEALGFECTCDICTINVGLREKILGCMRRDDEIYSLVSFGHVKQVLEAGKLQIRVYDEIGMSPKLYQWTYYDMFQAANREEAFSRPRARVRPQGCGAPCQILRGQQHRGS